jgi:hypothetical protein
MAANQQLLLIHNGFGQCITNFMQANVNLLKEEKRYQTRLEG